MVPSEGIVIKTPRARIWNVLAANFSQEMKEILKFLQINWGISKYKIGGDLRVSQRKCSENTTIFSTLIKGMPRRHVKKMSGHHSKVSCKRFGLCHATLSPGPQTQCGEIFSKGAAF